MTVGIMQPYLFPYIGYFMTIHAADEYVIYDDVQFIKGGWINRNAIAIGGNKVPFTVALKDASPNKLINEIEIQDTFEKLQKTFSMAYSKAPYHDEVMNLLREIFAYEDKNLARFTGNSLQQIANYCGLKTNFHYSSALKKDTNLKAQAKVIEICKELGGDRYINAIGGLELYTAEDFAAEGIELKFIKPNIREYKQLKGAFIPGLSIIDVMMNNAPDAITALCGDYELI